MTGSTSLPLRSYHRNPGRDFFHHGHAQKVSTDTVVVESLRRQYPELKLTVVPLYNCNLLSYAAAGQAKATLMEDPGDNPVYGSLAWRRYIPPGRQLDGGRGFIGDDIKFCKFSYRWKDHDFILYVVQGWEGMLIQTEINYILSTSEHATDDLILEAGFYQAQLHKQVWVFDQGYWQKSTELWQSVQKSSWDNVILEEDMKKAIINDVTSFFESRETYERLNVPWKRGLIYYGPPGNGKTISIKAMMHSLYNRKDAIPTLYVRTLVGYNPEYSLQSIFGKARQTAPCLLVFEDLDSIVTDDVRSYFLNEVDGLTANDGILMLGSTNHLDRLDPGIAKRPSRFDRKYYFPEPNFDERVAYCEFWREKLSDNDDVDFPQKLSSAIASITSDFSFAYIQEAFVAALLAIASRQAEPEQDFSHHRRRQGVDRPIFRELIAEDEDPELHDLVLWKEMKKQVKILRDEMDQEAREAGK